MQEEGEWHLDKVGLLDNGGLTHSPRVVNGLFPSALGVDTVYGRFLPLLPTDAARLIDATPPLLYPLLIPHLLLCPRNVLARSFM